jgi:N-acetylglutamate synthase-like GNAT family acetyltransferase
MAPLDTDPPDTSLRRATVDDVDVILELARRAHPGERLPGHDEVERLVENGWFLVLETAMHELLGTVHVRLERGVGYISWLVMSPEHRGHAMATRLLGVADALCAAFGCQPHEEIGHVVAA